MIRRAKAAGLSDFTSPAQLKPGARLIIPDRDRASILAVIGTEPVVVGLHVVGTYHDSPLIELTGRPIYPAGGFALFKTIYYGGIKKYQNIPLALVGRIDTIDGRTVDVSVSLNPGNPVFVIPDNAPHSDSEAKPHVTNVLQGEELDPVAGSIPGEKDSVEVEVVKLLTSIYKIKDLLIAELALVPASHPADVGFDRGLVGAYGQDDRGSSYCAVRAREGLKGTPHYTRLVSLTNFEEVAP
jgi:aspartyl aminopeptidase